MDDWRTLTHDFQYFGDGTVQSTHTQITNPKNQALVSLKLETYLDAYGRVSQTQLNNQPLCEVAYDTHGELAQAQCPQDTVFSFSRDAASHRLNGIYAQSTAWPTPASLTWELGPQGTVISEQLDTNPSVQQRQYHYDSRDFLSNWQQNGTAGEAYQYNATNLRSFNHPQTAYDTSGRVTRIGQTTFTYGPHGQVASAKDGAGNVTTYIYDEAGNRIFQKVNGKPRVAYLGGDTLTESQHIRQLDLGRTGIGMLVDGAYQPVLADVRGTTVVDNTGQVIWPMPYGEQIASQVLDIPRHYASGSYDTITGTVRLGLRDYHPATGQFLTPDPAMLSNPELCMSDPVQCNLYGYARNNPLTFADDDGQYAHVVVGAAVGGLMGAAWEGWHQYQQGELNAKRLAIATAGGAVTWGGIAMIPTTGANVASRLGVGLLAAEGNRATQSLLGSPTSIVQYVADIVLGGLFAASPAVKMDKPGHYGPRNFGTLHEPLTDAKNSVAYSFRSSTYTATKLSEPVTLYRVHGGKAGEIGSWWSRTPQSGLLQAQLDLALSPSWGNTAQYTSKIRVPAGTTIYEGVVADQRIELPGEIITGRIYSGGSSQVYIPHVSRNWLIP